MKKNVVVALMLLLPFLSFGVATYSGPNFLDMAAWNNGANWTPAGKPGPSEEVRFDKTIFIISDIGIAAGNDVAILGNGIVTINGGIVLAAGNLRINGANGSLVNNGLANFKNISYSDIPPNTTGASITNNGIMVAWNIKIGNGNNFLGEFVNNGSLTTLDDIVVEEGTFTNSATASVFSNGLTVKKGGEFINDSYFVSQGPFQSAKITVENEGIMSNSCSGTVTSIISGNPSTGGGGDVYAIDISGQFDNFGIISVGKEFPAAPNPGSKGMIVRNIGNFSSTGPCANFTFNIDASNCIIVDNTGPNGSFDADPATGVIHSGMNCTGLLLPVNLILFTGKISGSSVLLTWETSDEINSKDFEIQSSRDAVNFHSIGNVNANGGAENYYFASSHDQSINYYRLKMNDLDGKFDYSKTLFLKNELSNIDLNILPNLIQIGQDASVDISLDANISQAKIIIYSSQGQHVLNQTVDISKGLLHYNLSTTGFPQGLYYMVLTVDNKKLASSKFVVRS